MKFGLPSKRTMRICHQVRRQFSDTPSRHAARSIIRSPYYAELTDADISFFQSVLPTPGSVLTGADDVAGYTIDWMRKYRANPGDCKTAVLSPSTTDQVSKILKHCNERKIAIVPQGGNTGLVGGSIPVFDEVVLSTRKMDSIHSFDDVSGIVTCAAGVVLEKLDLWLAEKKYMCPLDLGAKGSCQIGGNVATNAGGLRLLRYGSLHGSVLGLEVVLPDGRILDLLSTLRKDNTGYDLKQLFIGSEGTIGVITAVSMLTPLRPTSIQVATLGVPSYSAVQQIYLRARAALGEILSAYEFYDSGSAKLVSNHLNIRNPFDTQPEFHVLIETQGSHENHDAEKLNGLLDSLMEDGLVVDGALAQDQTQFNAFWRAREGIPEACSKEGGNLKYDLSVPVPALYSIVTDMRAWLASEGFYKADGSGIVTHVIGFGHLGDGNLHLNITQKKGIFHPEVTNAVEPFVYQLVKKQRGSISAEHGLGLVKAPYLTYSKGAESIRAMRMIKELFDPKRIMNPYKYLPSHDE
ncbi:hypothetical protein SeMB42_g04671 [Synchytrium endobioticum]|uniref:FAD-binding PCMH-type domain-containing protein n=1 Tax=Synchytrium endobioticum TaxID=286115 RepID=A0A507CWQ6_9FUNG|nr:hypothetical protein SeLEV6574_g05534 [Synchytrium endobioticum]TPX43555.1 hypothetical protein SeMB42_g04671 [Synchytrium endobioticum]